MADLATSPELSAVASATKFPDARIVAIPMPFDLETFLNFVELTAASNLLRKGVSPIEARLHIPKPELAKSRKFYVTPWGDVHPAMPTRAYMEDMEERQWGWYHIPIKPEYEKNSW